MMNHLRSKVLKAQEDLQIEVDHLQEKTVEANHLLKKKMIEAEGLQEAFKNEELTLAGLKTALALEEERRKKAKVKITELKDQTSR